MRTIFDKRGRPVGIATDDAPKPERANRGSGISTSDLAPIGERKPRKPEAPVAITTADLPDTLPRRRRTED